MTVRSFSAQLHQLAAEQPDVVSLESVAADGTRERLTWAELDTWTTQVAHLLAARDVTAGSTVVIGYPNGIEHVVSAWATWRLGAMVLPINHRSPRGEGAALMEVARPGAVLADWPETSAAITRDELRAARRDGTPGSLPDVIPRPGKSVGSGGSTGSPKIIVDPQPWAKDPALAMGQLGVEIGFQAAKVQLVPGPLYHNMPFTWANLGLFVGQRVILMERFDARRMLELVESDGVEFMLLVPTMMRRAVDVFGERDWDLSSLKGVVHSAAACPAWVKRAWLEVLPAERLWEGFGSTENVGLTVVRGDDWLRRPGTVGRPFGCDLRILDDDGHELPPGQVGEIFMRPDDGLDHRYSYLGAPPLPTTQDGYASVGDFGWVDEEGWLYPADRRVDLIISGGSNVFPAEVEAALSSHPAVAEAVVIGLPDDDWGKRVHAIVASRTTEPPSTDELREHCASQLASYKVPKTWEFAQGSLRDEAGKVRRRQLVEERSLP